MKASRASAKSMGSLSPSECPGRVEKADGQPLRWANGCKSPPHAAEQTGAGDPAMLLCSVRRVLFNPGRLNSGSAGRLHSISDYATRRTVVSLVEDRMKPRTRNALLAIILLLSGVFVLARVLVLTIEAEYATHAEAESKGAVAKGWIPPFVPSSSTDIREVHDLDTNWQWLRFEAPAADLHAAVRLLRPLSVAEARERGWGVPRRIPGWPPKVDGPSSSARSALHFYHDPSPAPGARCLAIAWATERAPAYAWSC